MKQPMPMFREEDGEQPSSTSSKNEPGQATDNTSVNPSNHDGPVTSGYDTLVGLLNLSGRNNVDPSMKLSKGDTTVVKTPLPSQTTDMSVNKVSECEATSNEVSAGAAGNSSSSTMLTSSNYTRKRKRGIQDIAAQLMVAQHQKTATPTTQTTLETSFRTNNNFSIRQSTGTHPNMTATSKSCQLESMSNGHSFYNLLSTSSNSNLGNKSYSHLTKCLTNEKAKTVGLDGSVSSSAQDCAKATSILRSIDDLDSTSVNKAAAESATFKRQTHSQNSNHTTNSILIPKPIRLSGLKRSCSSVDEIAPRKLAKITDRTSPESNPMLVHLLTRSESALGVPSHQSEYQSSSDTIRPAAVYRKAGISIASSSPNRGYGYNFQVPNSVNAEFKRSGSHSSLEVRGRRIQYPGSNYGTEPTGRAGSSVDGHWTNGVISSTNNISSTSPNLAIFEKSPGNFTTGLSDRINDNFGIEAKINNSGTNFNNHNFNNINMISNEAKSNILTPTAAPIVDRTRNMSAPADTLIINQLLQQNQQQKQQNQTANILTQHITKDLNNNGNISLQSRSDPRTEAGQLNVLSTLLSQINALPDPNIAAKLLPTLFAHASQVTNLQQQLPANGSTAGLNNNCRTVNFSNNSQNGAGIRQQLLTNNKLEQGQPSFQLPQTNQKYSFQSANSLANLLQTSIDQRSNNQITALPVSNAGFHRPEISGLLMSGKPFLGKPPKYTDLDNLNLVRPSSSNNSLVKMTPGSSLSFNEVRNLPLNNLVEHKAPSYQLTSLSSSSSLSQTSTTISLSRLTPNLPSYQQKPMSKLPTTDAVPTIEALSIQSSLPTLSSRSTSEVFQPMSVAEAVYYPNIQCILCHEWVCARNRYMHIESHLQYKPYKCSQCEYGNRKEIFISLHLARHHSGTGKVLYLPNAEIEKKAWQIAEECLQHTRQVLLAGKAPTTTSSSPPKTSIQHLPIVPVNRKPGRKAHHWPHPTLTRRPGMKVFADPDGAISNIMQKNIKRAHDKQILCQICGAFVLKTSAFAEDHVRSHLSEQSLTCIEAGCGTKHYARNFMLRHMKEVHKLRQHPQDALETNLPLRHEFFTLGRRAFPHFYTPEVTARLRQKYQFAHITPVSLGLRGRPSKRHLFQLRDDAQILDDGQKISSVNNSNSNDNDVNGKQNFRNEPTGYSAINNTNSNTNNGSYSRDNSCNYNELKAIPAAPSSAHLNDDECQDEDVDVVADSEPEFDINAHAKDIVHFESHMKINDCNADDTREGNSREATETAASDSKFGEINKLTLQGNIASTLASSGADIYMRDRIAHKNVSETILPDPDQIHMKTGGSRASTREIICNIAQPTDVGKLAQPVEIGNEVFSSQLLKDFLHRLRMQKTNPVVISKQNSSNVP